MAEEETVMYESFGASVDQAAKTVTFRVFFPDNALDPSQYQRGGLPRIAQMKVIGDFQSQIGGRDWDIAGAPVMQRTQYQNLGWEYSYTTTPLADNFYQYKYFVTFENATTRYVSDPCTKYGGSGDKENSAFVVGGPLITGVNPIGRLLSPRDLVLYELMIDDFTAEYRGNRAPVDAIWDKLDYLQNLGINGIEFMPWTAWPGGDFSWGYNPFQFFSVAYRYVHDATDTTNKLYRLKALIDELHRRNIHVVLDGTFEDVNAGSQPNRGFPYLWFYQTPSDSPYVGSKGQFYTNFDYDNSCTEQFIRDACLYWIDAWQIDGIRFDYARGYLRHGDRSYGVVKIVGDLVSHAAAIGRRNNMSFTLEDLTDPRYVAIDDTNQTDATGCWFDPFMWKAFQYASTGQLDGEILRVLNSNLDFAPGKSPVTYLENHDHSTLVRRAGGRDRWYKTQAPAISLLTSPGIVLIHNGQEFGEDYFMLESGPDRVIPRPLRWAAEANDRIGQSLYHLYQRLIGLRAAHPSLRSPNYFPATNQDGYGVFPDIGVVVYHRYGPADDGSVERFIIVLNYSDTDRFVDVPFPTNGVWQELLNAGAVNVQNFLVANTLINSNWGKIYFNQTQAARP
jgi:pullulanase